MRSRLPKTSLFLAVLALWPAPAAADVLGDWNTLASDQVRSAGLALPAATRVLAIAQLSAFEAVNATSKEYTPFHAVLEVATPVSPEAAAASALHDHVGSALASAGAPLSTPHFRSRSVASTRVRQKFKVSTWVSALLPSCWRSGKPTAQRR